MEPITLKDIVSIITPVLTLIVGVGIGVIGYFLKSIHKDIKEKFEQSDEKINRVEHDYMEFKASMPRHYVLKDDYIRTLSVFEKKLDDIGKDVKNINGRKHGEP